MTVFAAWVFGDLPRIWLACLRRSLPPDDVRFKVFDDSLGDLDEFRGGARRILRGLAPS